MGAEEIAIPILFVSFLCGCVYACCYCHKKDVENEEREKDEKKEKIWANAQVVQPPMVDQNQR